VIWVESFVFSGVFISTTVAKPDIVVGVGEDETWGFVLVVD
jgi:hypothetical protein